MHLENSIINIIILCFLVLFFGCSKDSEHGPTSIKNHPTNPDTSIFVTSFPSNLYLTIGKSIKIDNVNTIITFISVIEDTRSIVNNEVTGNAKVQLSIDYGYLYKVITLNTNDIPQTYYWEDGNNYVIQLKDLVSLSTTQEITLEINKYFYL